MRWGRLSKLAVDALGEIISGGAGDTTVADDALGEIVKVGS